MMRYMTFPASCSFCCVADMLEYMGIQTTDREIVVGAELPYIFRYDELEDSFSTGVMLQKREDYDRFLRKYDLHFEENTAKREDTAKILLQHKPCMIGLKNKFGKHAVVFTKYKDGQFYFLNPHRYGDGQEDEVILTERELLERASEENSIGNIAKGSVSAEPEDTSQTIATIAQYSERFQAFCEVRQRYWDIVANQEKLLRPVALDMPVMMELVGESALRDKLGVMCQQTLQMVDIIIETRKDCVPAEIIDLKMFRTVMKDYKEVVERHSSTRS